METCSKVSGASEKTKGAAKQQSGYQKCSQGNQHEIRIAFVEHNDDLSRCHSHDKNPDNRCSTPLCIMCHFRPFLERFQRVLNFLFSTLKKRISLHSHTVLYFPCYAISPYNIHGSQIVWATCGIKEYKEYLRSWG